MWGRQNGGLDPCADLLLAGRHTEIHVRFEGKALQRPPPWDHPGAEPALPLAPPGPLGSDYPILRMRKLRLTEVPGKSHSLVGATWGSHPGLWSPKQAPFHPSRICSGDTAVGGREGGGTEPTDPIVPSLNLISVGKMGCPLHEVPARTEQDLRISENKGCPLCPQPAPTPGLG